jgi:hypothetical protein
MKEEKFFQKFAEKQMQNKYGGARKGAGKPAQFDKPMKRKEVMLPDEAIEFFLALGNGNISAGVRQAWRSLTKRVPDVKLRSEK